MSTIINGSSPSITFSDSTTQASAGLTAASPTIASGVLTYPNGATNGGYINGGTAVASTSGTSIDFTSIPSWVKRVTVMMNGVSTNGTSLVQIQLGTTSGVETTGYNSGAVIQASATLYTGNVTTGFVTGVSGYASASQLRYGTYIISLLGSNAWAGQGNIHDSSQSGLGAQCAGAKGLTATLDRVRITTVNGTDTFDAGSINILYE